MCCGGAGRFLNLCVRRAGAAKADVFTGGGGEDHRVLRDQRQTFAQVLAGRVSDIDIVDNDTSGIRIIKPLKQLKYRGFPSAGCANQCDGLPRFYVQ